METNTSKQNSNPVNATNKALAVLGVIILVVGFFAFGFVFGRESQYNPATGNLGKILNTDSTSDSTPATDTDMKLFWNVWNTMKNEYVDGEKANSQQMYYGAIKGMVDSFDDSATLFLTLKRRSNSMTAIQASFLRESVQN